MYLFGNSYFETYLFKEVFQIAFIFFIISELFILGFTFSGISKNLVKKENDKGSFWIIVLGIISSILFNMTCRRSDLFILSMMLFWIGIAFIIMGILLRICSVLTLRKFFTLSVKVSSNQKIIQTGPYKYIRHPAYSGSILSLIGISLAFRSFIGIAGTIIIIIIIYGYRIKVEEMMLENNFKTSYQEYKKHTKKIIPFIW